MHFSHKYKTSFFLSLLHHSHEHLIHKLFLPHEVVLKMMELSISTHTFIHAHAATASRTMFIPSSIISNPLFSPLLQSRPRHARLYLLTPSSQTYSIPHHHHGDSLSYWTTSSCCALNPFSLPTRACIHVFASREKESARAR